MRSRITLVSNPFQSRWTKIVACSIMTIVVLVNLNILSWRSNSTTAVEIVQKVKCESATKTLALAELAAYYEKLLLEKGVNTNTIKDAIASKSGKIFNVFYDTKVGADKKMIIETIPPAQNVPPPSPSTTPDTRFKGDTKIVFKELGSTNILKGVMMDWWFDFCMARESTEVIWHPLLPRVPQLSAITLTLADKDRTVGSNLYRRMSGYLFVKETASFDFKLLSRDGAEVLVYDTGLTLSKINEINPKMRYDSKKELFHSKLTKATMDAQDKVIPLSAMFQIESQNIELKKDQIYALEIIQGGKHFTKYSLQWKPFGSTFNRYTAIGQENLFHQDGKMVPGLLKQKYDPKPIYSPNDSELRRLSFYKLPMLESRHLIDEAGLYCEEREKRYIKVDQLYQGYNEYTDNVKSYPQEYFKFGLDNRYTLLDKATALQIADRTFKKLSRAHQSTLELVNVVYVMSNFGPLHNQTITSGPKYFFVELDVRNKSHGSKVFRASHFVEPINEPTKDLCFVREWAPKGHGQVEINLMTAIKNQRAWLNYLILMLEELLAEIKDTNVILNLIDYNSTDGDYEQILKASKLKFKYLNPIRDSKLSTKFSKVKALNYGIKHVQNENSIVFILDLHLQLPLNIFDRIRKLTIQNRTAYNPTLMKMGCGDHEQYTPKMKSTIWLDYGTGMMSMYKSDWMKVGCFNEKLFKDKWGGEDWEVMDRMVGNGIQIIHQRLPRFYHIHHDRKHMWNKT
ncbi:uncharacterized protein [Clytia hemisphaerica]|uniref:Hexosyltransferase n=1 Tax=Clytia hemisphaerica TaxID=252671 RepID=A0A7M5VA45_9CNID